MDILDRAWRVALSLTPHSFAPSRVRAQYERWRARRGLADSPEDTQERITQLMILVDAVDDPSLREDRRELIRLLQALSDHLSTADRGHSPIRPRAHARE